MPAAAPSRQAGANTLWGSDVIANALREQDVPYACLNPGASYRGLHDSMVNYLGNKTPKMIVCLHEEHAVGIAHGYAMVTNKPLIAIVHSNVGLMHASMGVFNVWCNRAPMVLIGATGPVDAMKRRPWIDWIHTSADQGALVRNYTKWDDQPASPGAAVESIRRAFQIAQTRPFGPTYVNLDAAIQEMPLDAAPKTEPVKRFGPAPDLEPPRAQVEAAVKAIAAARKPLILSGRCLRAEDGWRQRVELASWIGARVITSSKDPASFPSTHPLYAGEIPWRLRPNILELVKSSDCIIALDWVDVGGTINQAFPPGGGSGPTVINISNDHLVHNGWSMDYEILPATDIWLPVTSEAGVTSLLEGLAKANVTKKTTAARAVPKVAPPERTKGAYGVADLARLFAIAAEGEKVSIICPLARLAAERQYDRAPARPPRLQRRRWSGCRSQHGGRRCAGIARQASRPHPRRDPRRRRLHDGRERAVERLEPERAAADHRRQQPVVLQRRGASAPHRARSPSSPRRMRTSASASRGRHLIS